MILDGIDVSQWQGTIDWKKVKESKYGNFAIIRAGYGKNKYDSFFERNVKQCKANNIPFAVYWFSYALSVPDAVDEALKAIDGLKKLGVKCCIWFDYEYDSRDFARNKLGKYPSNTEIDAIAEAFCSVCASEGYHTGIYTNADFAKRMPNACEKWPLWVASWGGKPKMPFAIHQYSSTGAIPGINGNVDIDRIGGDFKMFFEKRYQFVEDLPDLYREPIQALVDNGCLAGTSREEKTEIDLTEDMARTLVICYRMVHPDG